MDTPMLWVLFGLILILSELLATSVIAVFFGIAAVVVGLLLWAGIIESWEMQFFLFGSISLLLWFTARKRLKRLFVGDVVEQTDKHQTFRDNLGQRAVAVTDFVHGQGRVRLNGVAWQAESLPEDAAIGEGDQVWIIANDGIQLTVSKTPPTPSQD